MMNELTEEKALNLVDGLNEQQKAAVLHPINYCTKIVAGAGTGKTKIISKRFVKLVQDLIEDGVEKPATRLLVITFTDKAANEMKERISKELKVNNIDCLGQELWISTFHSFCSKILRKHSIEANLSPSFKLGDEKQLKEIFDNIIKKIKYGEFNTIENIEKIASSLGLDAELLNINSVNKLRAIDDLDSVFEDIWNLIAKIKAQGLNAKDFLTKTLDATEKYSQIVENIPFKFESKEDYAQGWGDYLSKYTDDYCNFGVEEFDNIAKTKLILDKFGSRKGAAWGFANGYPENISKANELEIHLTKIVSLIYAAYQNELEMFDVIDFDDLINKTIEIFRQNEMLRLYYQKLFKHLIIDEFQDTNGSQLALIRLLLDENEANITFVGDRKQSIYGFRFAQMENLEVLHEIVETKYDKKFPGISLITNYRSTSHVLTAVNHVTTEELKLDETLLPNPAKSFEEENRHVKVTSLKGLTDAYTQKISEAKYIASEIARLRKEEGANYKDFAVLVKSHSQADLIEKQLSNVGIPAIKRVNLGFFASTVIKNVIGLLRLAGNFRDEQALVRVLKIKLSDNELYGLKTFADAEILKVKDFDTLKSYNFSDKILFLNENKIELPKMFNSYLKSIFEVVSSIKSEKNLSLLQIFYALTEKIKPYSNLSGIEQYQAEYDIKVFEKIIADYMQGENYVSISNFIDYLNKIQEDRNFELPSIVLSNVDAVQLLTIHASKGLEFPYVFIPSIKNAKGSGDKTRISFDLQYGNKPGFGIIIHKFKGKDTPKSLVYKEIWKKPREENEARRLFYVAVSRAEKYLNILSFEPYGNNGGVRPVGYIQNMTDVLPCDIVEVSDIKVERQDFKPLRFKTDKIIDAQKVLESDAKTFYKMSFSQLNAFSRCSNKFLLKYKFHYPEITEKSDDNSASDVGSIVHNLIYNSYMARKSFTVTEVPMFLANIELSRDDLTSINELYTAFVNSDYSPEKLLGREIYPERSINFDYKIGDISDDLSDDLSVEFSGDIDLLSMDEQGEYLILDFKTNKEIEKSLKNYYKQLLLYKMALKNEGIDVKTLKIVSLTKNGAKDFELLGSEIENVKAEFEAEVRNVISISKVSCMPKASVGSKCKNCGYKYLCT